MTLVSPVSGTVLPVMDPRQQKDLRVGGYEFSKISFDGGGSK
jgi:hypothetical protein